MLRLGVTSAAIRIPAGKGTVALKTGPKRTAKTSGTPPASIAIIGGSGLYSIAGLSEAKEVRVKTPFGDPSDAIVTGLLEGKRVAFLARHGRGHRFPPGEINYRANIYALKLLGADRIISVSAVGSLREELAPGDFLVADQFVDRTRHRVSTFFGAGLVAHVSFDKPTCPEVSRVLADDDTKTLLGRFGYKLEIGDERVSQGRTALAFTFSGKRLHRFAENALGVFGVLIQRGDDLRASNRFMAGMPAVVVGDHGDRAVTDLCFARQLGFGDVGHADDVETEGPMHMGFRQG